jgi:uncharacterized protein (DUF427 family)
MSSPVIAQSISGEVRIEAGIENGQTVFRTYLLNTHQRSFDSKGPETQCNPKGIAAYYAEKVQRNIRLLLTEKKSTTERVDDILAELVSDMC